MIGKYLFFDVGSVSRAFRWRVTRSGADYVQGLVDVLGDFHDVHEGVVG
jgi:hypothetical protein